MGEFDDPVVRDALRRMAGDPGNEQAALDRVVAGARRARRRQRTLVAGGWAAAAIVVVAAIISVTGDDGDERLIPATVPTTAQPPTIATPTPTTAPAPTSTAAPATRPPAAAATTSPATQPATTPPPTVAATNPPPTTAAPTTVAPTALPPRTDPQPAAPETRTFSSGGGSIEVRRDGEALALASPPAPAGDYTSRVEDEGPDRVRVRFCGQDDSYRITVTVEGGEMVPEIEPGSATGACG